MMKWWPFAMAEKQLQEEPGSGQLTEIRLFVKDDLYRAFQRCVWMQVHESGRERFDIMEEVVVDFLIKHKC
jgi:hypothetical protein